MTRATQKKCLIIIPQNWEHEEGDGEPDWGNVMCSIEGHASLTDKSKEDEIALFYKDNNMATYVMLLTELIIAKDEKDLSDLLVSLYDYFYESKDIELDNFENVVLVGHFNAHITEVRDFFEEALRTATEEEKEKLQKFEGPIMGRGNFIIDSYTLGGLWNKGAKELIDQLKKANEEEEVKCLFRKIFDFFWYQHKLPELISNMKGHLFMYVQSGGKCGSEELQASVAEFKECEKILRDEYKVNEDLSLIYNVRGTSMTELNHGKIGEINDQLDRILLAILKKRAGKSVNIEEQA